jgi:hypothetical protein
VLAYGGSGAPRVRFLEDDNAAPAVAAQAKIRLINAVAGSQPMTLRADFQSIVTNIDPGAASAYAVVTGATSSRVEVTTPGAGVLFTRTSSGSQPLLLAQGVYTLFMLGGNASPSGELSKDR